MASLEQIREFASKTMPLLAKHFLRADITAFRAKHKWANKFTTEEFDLPEAYKKYFDEGAQYLVALEELVEMSRLEQANIFITRSPFGHQYVQVVSGISAYLTDHQAKSSLSSASGSFCTNENLEDAPGVPDDIRNKHPDSGTASFMIEAERILKGSADDGGHLSHIDTYDVTFTAWKDQFNSSNLQRFLVWIEAVMKRYDEALDVPSRWMILADNLRNLTARVGCPRVHQRPEDNIAELRLFSATQMPVFQKLQTDLSDAKREIQKQREVITALIFRHHLETLPPGSYKGNATDRWQKFWEDSVITEKAVKTNQRTLANNRPHALTALLDKCDPHRGVVSLNPPASAAKTGQIGQITAKTAVGQKAQVYLLGKILYGTLSSVIHSYGGTEAKGFKVEEDQWGLTVRDILKTLTPENFDADGVDLAEEQKRFV